MPGAQQEAESFREWVVNWLRVAKTMHFDELWLDVDAMNRNDCGPAGKPATKAALMAILIELLTERRVAQAVDFWSWVPPEPPKKAQGELF